jgi:hypothetical protein
MGPKSRREFSRRERSLGVVGPASFTRFVRLSGAAAGWRLGGQVRDRWDAEVSVGIFLGWLGASTSAAVGCSAHDASSAASPVATVVPDDTSPMSGGAPPTTAGSAGAPIVGSGGFGAGGAPSTATTVADPTMHDPSLFAWPEGNADGGTAELCKPGHYVGTYMCAVQPPPAYKSFFGDAGIGYTVTGSAVNPQAVDLPSAVLRRAAAPGVTKLRRHRALLPSSPSGPSNRASVRRRTSAFCSSSIAAAA